MHFKNSEEAFETLLLATEAACVGVWDLNIPTGELHWSQITKSIFGVTTPGSIRLQDFADRVHPEDRERVVAAVNEALDPDGPGQYDIEYRIVRPNGEERYVAAKGKGFFEVSNDRKTATRFIGTLLDRTEQKRSEAALIQAEQLAATGRLAASIAHEINNPLASVTNLLYLLREEEDDATRREYVQAAESEMARVSEIASNTLRFYRDPKGISRVQVPALLKSVLRLFQGRAALCGVEVDLCCDENAEVLAYQGELRQVLVNLVGNAIDAMPKGGRLQIRCRAFVRTIGRLRPRIELAIADTGIGMSSEVLEKAFEPFYTTKGDAGTGIGLWLSREILKKHGFQLRVKSKPGRGTVFRMLMPTTSLEASESSDLRLLGYKEVGSRSETIGT